MTQDEFSQLVRGRKVDLQRATKDAIEQIFDEGHAEVVKKLKHLMYKDAYLNRKIKETNKNLERLTKKQSETIALIESINGGDYGSLSRVDLKEKYETDEQDNQGGK